MSRTVERTFRISINTFLLPPRAFKKMIFMLPGRSTWKSITLSERARHLHKMLGNVLISFCCHGEIFS